MPRGTSSDSGHKFGGAGHQKQLPALDPLKQLFLVRYLFFLDGLLHTSVSINMLPN